MAVQYKVLQKSEESSSSERHTHTKSHKQEHTTLPLAPQAETHKSGDSSSSEPHTHTKSQKQEHITLLPPHEQLEINTNANEESVSPQNTTTTTTETDFEFDMNEEIDCEEFLPSKRQKVQFTIPSSSHKTQHPHKCTKNSTNCIIKTT
eukprot:TRINITY_DN17531_c0_g1_i1.p1 TRINITY_DN17531_c0_g1~~TRINITY_DN17531_c0_g1_i1.p1  ORF type:complete len:149 (-),score=43.99 TRINITY_DN17531_c0_g1_i1:29-475(-)